MKVTNVKNNQVFEAQILDDDQVQVGNKIIKLSTFRRYYKKVEQVDPPKIKFDWKKYYKTYKRNEIVLFDVKFKDGKLLFLDEKEKAVISCQLSKTKTCVVVEQLGSRAKRYFNKPQQAINHICYDQGLYQVQIFKTVFEKWYKAQIK